MNGDSLACIAASPASGANTFAEIVLLPMIEQRLSDKEKNNGRDIVVQGRHRACSIELFSPYWPHMLFKHANDDLHDNNHQFSKWRFTFLRHPLDRILISYLLLKSSLSRGGGYDNNNENPQLDMTCTDSMYVALNNCHNNNNNNKGNNDEFQNNRLLSSELTLKDYFKIDVDGLGQNVYSKFYLKEWNSTHKWGGGNNNKQCEGSPYSMRPRWSNDEKHVS